MTPVIMTPVIRGTQYQLLDAIPKNSFGTPRPLTEGSLNVTPSAVKTVEANKVIDVGFETSNLQTKLEGYLLDAAHPQNQTKATWFQQALGFDKNNWQNLASQLKFNEATAIQTKTTQYGTTFEQSIPITGVNGKTVNITFVFMKDTNGVVRLITGIPTKK